MALAVAVLLWLLAGLVVCLLVIALVPVHLHVRATSGGPPEIRVELRLFNAGLPPVLKLAPGRWPERDGKARKPSKARKARKSRPDGWVSARLRRGLPHLVAGLPGLISDTLAGIRLDYLRAKGRFGFSDPAETGRVFGQLCPVIHGLPNDRIDLTCTPDFDRSCLEGEIEMAVHFQIIRLTAPALGFFWRSVIWPG